MIVPTPDSSSLFLARLGARPGRRAGRPQSPTPSPQLAQPASRVSLSSLRRRPSPVRLPAIGLPQAYSAVGAGLRRRPQRPEAQTPVEEAPAPDPKGKIPIPIPSLTLVNRLVDVDK